MIFAAGPLVAEELSGRIVNHLGEGLDHVKIQVFDIATGEATSGIPYRALPDGRFGPIRVDEPGRYRLVATHMRNRSTMRYMTQVVDLNAPDADAVVVMKPVRRYRIEGKVVDAPERAVIHVDPVEVAPDGGPDDWPRNVFVQHHGLFSLTGLPLGRYRLDVAPFGADRSAARSLGELEVSGDRTGVILDPHSIR